jgi:hypothetical protein
MAISIIQPLNAAYPEGTFDFPDETYTDASGATYKIGAVLSPSGGDLVEATAASPTASIAGIALQPGSNITGTHVANSVGNAGVQTPLLMCVAADGQIFEGTFANGGNDVAPVATDLWVAYGLTKDGTSSFWYVDKAKTTTNASVTIIAIKNIQDIVLGTTVGARVFFKFRRAQTIY